MDLTCREELELDMQTLDDKSKELENAWNDILKQKREIDARIHTLEQQEMQFKIKWEFLIQETQRLAEDREKFERRQAFFKEVAANESRIEDDNIIHGELFFSGISDEKQLKKRYRDLLKIYHTDNECGDNATVIEINREYDNLRQSMN